MRILIVHNKYQIPGGEESVVAQDHAALLSAGATVDTLQVSNHNIKGLVQQIKTAATTAYSISSRALLAQRIASFRPDLVHVHNFFPVLTPSIYDASHEIPFVQTLHNYRTVCANSFLFRDGKICLDCVGKTIPWPAIQHACYRGSRLGSATVAAMIAVHSSRGTWQSRVTRFIVLTEFARDFFLRTLKLRDDQVVVKRNATADSGLGDGAGGYALFVGRLSLEKGISTLLAAAERGLPMKLKVAGEGPLSRQVQAAADRGLLEYVGRQSRESVSHLMKRARLLLLPSLWYEGLPMVIPEAYASGLPVVASNLGGLSSLVLDGNTGFLVNAGSDVDLADAVSRFAASPSLEASMRANCRATYEQLYRPEENVRQLLAIYESSIQQKAVERTRAAI